MILSSSSFVHHRIEIYVCVIISKLFITCPLFAEILKKKSFSMLHDNNCVVTCPYLYIDTYTDVYVYCVLFCFGINVYIIVPIFIRITNDGYNWCILLNLYCFYALSEVTKLASYIYMHINYLTYLCAATVHRYIHQHLWAESKIKKAIHTN